MQLSTTENVRLKEIELDILKAFVSICEKHDICYYLAGGTLLGAVRHKGFIPWDDDIDVLLPRQDYDRFIEIAQNELPSHLFLQTWCTDTAYPANFAKIRDNRTTFVEKSLKDLPINHGVYIDLFPLDYFPQTRLCQKWKLFWWRLSDFSIGQVFYREQPLTYKQRLLQVVSRVLFGSLKNTLAKREKWMRSEGKSTFVISYCGAWGEREVARTEWFAEGVDVEFERLCLRAPKDYDAYLRRLYGDYMQLPPIEKQVGHHYTDIVDLDKSYLSYRK